MRQQRANSPLRITSKYPLQSVNAHVAHLNPSWFFLRITKEVERLTKSELLHK